MTFGLLLDEHAPAALIGMLTSYDNRLRVQQVGRSPAPPKSTPDPELLAYGDANDLCLVTKDKSTMLVHLLARLDAGLRSAGIALFTRPTDINETAESLRIMWTCRTDDEVVNQIEYLPY